MKIEVQRRFKGDQYTIGTMYIDGTKFCDTLEDRVRDLTSEAKVMHHTAIPAGIYEVVLNHSPRFKRDLPRLLAVPHFDGILIHRGNTAADTSGCILVGENKVKRRVINSTQYEVDLVKRCRAATLRREKITITVR